MGEGRGGEEERGKGRGGPLPPESEAPGGRTPRGCDPRNVPSARRAGRGAAHLSAGAGRRRAGPTPSRAPRPSAPSRPFPPALRRRSAPLRPSLSLAPSLLPSLPARRSRSSGRLAGRGCIRASALAHLGARSQPRTASPKLLPGKGPPAPPAPRPFPTRLDGWCLRVPRPPRAGAGLRAVPGSGSDGAGDPRRPWPERGAGDATGRQV